MFAGKFNAAIIPCNIDNGLSRNEIRIANDGRRSHYFTSDV